MTLFEESPPTRESVKFLRIASYYLGASNGTATHPRTWELMKMVDEHIDELEGKLPKRKRVKL